VPQKDSATVPTAHTVKAYDEELRHLKSSVVEMGGLAEHLLSEAVRAIAQRDERMAEKVISDDKRVDRLDEEVQRQVQRLLALRQPVASDLRAILASLKMATDLERIADLAKNSAKRVIALNQMPQVAPTAAVVRLGRQVQQLIREAIDAYVRDDEALAHEVWQRDEEIDALYTSLFREVLTYMMEDSRTITPCTHLLFVAKNFERAGDHATNIAETVHYFVRGEPLEGERPKGDSSSFALVAAEAQAAQDSEAGA
jgi:phosphate transport system protein